MLKDTAKQFKGKIQNYGTHASAVVVFTQDLYDFCAIEKFANDKYNLNYDFKDLEAMGLLKLDILGLETLDIMDNCLELIPEDKRPDIYNLRSSKKAYDLLKNGFTQGVFQLESNLMGKLIRDIKPESIHDTNCIVALGRPGPIQAGIVDEFVENKRCAKIKESIEEKTSYAAYATLRDLKRVSELGPVAEMDAGIDSKRRNMCQMILSQEKGAS